MKQKQLLIIGFSLCFLFLGACDATTESAEKTASGEKDSVRLASWSQPISEQINLLVDAEKHFFQENNLDITFIPGAGGGDAIKNILTGKADIAFTDPGSLFGALDKGEKLKVIYNIYPQNVFNVVSLKEKNITKPEDLKGKTIGVYSLSSGTRQNLLILLHQVGLTEADVNIVETGLLNFAPLIQGQVDATAATDTGLFLGKQKGLSDVNVMEVKDVLNFPSDVFVVTEEMYEENKELLTTFIKSYQESAEWMMEEPKEAAALAVEHAIDGKDEETNYHIIQLRNEASKNKQGMGYTDINTLQKAADMYRELGLIENQLNLSDDVTNEFIPR